MIVIADLHLGKTNDSIMVDGVPSQTRDIQKRLRDITARAKMTKQSIAVAGDVFNRVNPTTQSISVLFSWLRHCHENRINVYLIAGNHDAGVDWTSTVMLEQANLPNITVITSPGIVTVTDDVICRSVLFFPHVPTVLQETAEQGHGSVSRWVSSMFTEAEFVITHGMISDQDYSNDIFFEAGNAMRIEPAEFKNLKLMVLGHIHGHTFGDKWVYPGSVTINNFGEVDESKGWVEVDLETLEYTWHEYSDDGVIPWVHVVLDLTDKDETSIPEESVEAMVSGAVVKVTVNAKAHGVIDEAYIRRMFGKYCFVSRFETKVVSELTRPEIAENVLSHDDLLVEYLSAADISESVREGALEAGRRIISEVMS